MGRPVDAALRDRVERHYQRCVEALRAKDLDGFLAWLGADGTFVATDGSTVRVADARPFWEWRFRNVLEVERSEIDVGDVRWSDDGLLLVVDFHEEAEFVVRGFDGEQAERHAFLDNRNYWEVSEEGLTTRGGEELRARRTLDGQPLTDENDPWGFSAWARHREAHEA